MTDWIIGCGCSASGTGRDTGIESARSLDDQKWGLVTNEEVGKRRKENKIKFKSD